MFDSRVENMPPDEHSVFASKDDFARLIQTDIDSIRHGQSHCYIHVSAASPPEETDSDDSIALAIADLVPEHLPPSAVICELSSSNCGIWLPRHSRDDATKIARFLRYSINNQLLGNGNNGENSPKGCAIGLVVVRQSNWAADALVRTAQITAATAGFDESNGIRVADQINGKNDL